MTMTSEGKSTEIVAIDGAVYTKDQGTAKWHKVDPKEMSSTDVSNLADPRTMVSVMEGVTGKDLGTKQVGGVSTRQYSFEIPISAFVNILSPGLLKRMQGTVKSEYSTGDDNLLRKLTTVRTVSGQKVSTEFTYSDWGKPVSIVAPAAADLG